MRFTGRWRWRVARSVVIGACALVANAAGGCSGGEAPVESAEDPVAAPDPAVLENAQRNQRTMADAGYRLTGRVWFSTDTYGEIYEGDGGAAIGTFVTRGNGPFAERPELAPTRRETFPQYVARVRQATTGRAHSHSGDGDVLLFDASPPPGNDGATLGRTSQALFNERCPISTFDRFCGMRAEWWGSSIVRRWRLTDVAGVNSQTARGSDVNAVVCADRSHTTLSIAANNQSRANIFVSGEVDVLEGTLFHWWEVGGWWETEVCADWLIIGVSCLDNEIRTNFDHADFRARITPRNGGNAHFCGSIGSRSHVQFDGSCMSVGCVPWSAPSDAPNPCEDCADHFCATQRAACDANSTCLLMEDCAADCTTWDCVLRCGAWLPPSPPIGSTYNDLLICVAQQCGSHC